MLAGGLLAAGTHVGEPADARRHPRARQGGVDRLFPVQAPFFDVHAAPSAVVELAAFHPETPVGTDPPAGEHVVDVVVARVTPEGAAQRLLRLWRGQEQPAGGRGVPQQAGGQVPGGQNRQVVALGIHLAVLADDRPLCRRVEFVGQGGHHDATDHGPPPALGGLGPVPERLKIQRIVGREHREALHPAGLGLRAVIPLHLPTLVPEREARGVGGLLDDGIALAAAHRLHDVMVDGHDVDQP